MAFGPLFQNGFMPTIQSNSDTLLQTGIGLLSGRNPQEQAAYAGQAIGNMRARNKTAAALRSSGANDLADALENGSISGNDAFKLWYAQKLKDQADDGLVSAGGAIYDKKNRQWITPPAGNSANKYGLTPIWGTIGGKTVLLQPGTDGTVNTMQLPEGFTPNAGYNNLDIGTAIVPQDKKTGALGEPVQKDVAGAANQKALGEGQGAAAVALPSAMQLASQIDSQIQDLKSDPYLPNMVGSVPYTDGMVLHSDLPNRSPEANRVQDKINQLKGGSFLQARQILKGGGAITDYEGKKADDAYNRINTAQNMQDFNKALDDFNDAVKAGVAKLQQQAQGNFGVGQPTVTAPPSGGGNVTSTGIQFSVGQ